MGGLVEDQGGGDEMYRLKELALEVLEDEYPPSKRDDGSGIIVSGMADCGDIAHEIVDGMVPVYTANLLRLALDDLWLASTVPEIGSAFDGTSTAVNIIAANVYEELYQKVYEKCEGTNS